MSASLHLLACHLREVEDREARWMGILPQKIRKPTFENSCPPNLNHNSGLEKSMIQPTAAIVEAQGAIIEPPQCPSQVRFPPRFDP